jgi:hypothetical protein
LDIRTGITQHNGTQGSLKGQQVSWAVSSLLTSEPIRHNCALYPDARQNGAPVNAALYGEIDDRAMTNGDWAGFTKQASAFWMAIPAEARAKLLANVYCGHCRGAVSIDPVRYAP